MSEAALLSQIQQDLKTSPAQMVIYLEGKTDLDPFFALIGKSTPLGGIQLGALHQDVLVRGLAENGSGSTAVKARVDLATRAHLTGVLGIVDGDGLPLTVLSAKFDASHAGPLFHWKAYCIENLLVKTGWPASWGPAPDWEETLISFGPYVALNRVFTSLDSVLSQFRWSRHTHPSFPKPLITDTEVIAAINSDKQLILNRDLGQEFQEELAQFHATVQRDTDEAHALLNGKWLLSHLARARTNRTRDQCRGDWITHAIAVGGLPEVRDWWERVTGNPP
jgi:hypothetical protein